MPRDGSGIYTTPAGTTAVPDTTIESAKYNGNVADVAADLNAPRPIVAGGTGGNSAAAARTNLKAEVAGQQVTNYDTHIFENGSFWSAPGATAAPESVYISGICDAFDANHINLRASTFYTTAVNTYTRQKVGGAWGAWTDADARYVNVTGDTMTGPLAVNASAIIGAGTAGVNTELRINGGTGAYPGGTAVRFDLGGTPVFVMGNASAILGGAQNNDFLLFMSSATPGSALRINAANSTATFGGPVTVNGAATLAGNLTIAKDLPVVTLTDSGTTGSYIVGKKATGSARWEMAVGGGAGFDFGLSGYNDAGAGIEVLNINRGTGNIKLSSRILLNSYPLPAANAAINMSYAGSNTQYGIALRNADGSSGTAVQFSNVSDTTVGTIQVNNSATSFNTASDADLKEDLKSFDAGKIIDDTNVYDFAWKSTGERSFGVIAQQAVEVYPTAVTHLDKNEKDGKDEWWGIDYSKYVPVLLQELKALRARVAELEGRLDPKPP